MSISPDNLTQFALLVPGGDTLFLEGLHIEVDQPL
jgi:hypothetical protein